MSRAVSKPKIEYIDVSHDWVFFHKMKKDGTRYLFSVAELNEVGIRETGGKYLISILSPVRSVYAFNDGYKDPSYVMEKFTGLTWRDAQNVAEMLNQYFGVQVE